MDAKLEQDLHEQLEIATRMIEEGREPTATERARFLALKAHIESASPAWRQKVADAINRLASALEGVGL